ncbi:MAG: type VI secretion system baseplate subunit TssE [Gammaproteobacteria bacterium]|nr:type VI secretion system baseplate subunit TssE [Gammaproteobacteria bacterium]
MAFEKSLLERIDSGGDDIYNTKIDPQRIVSSIMTHLSKMMNVRQGSVTILPDYGIPDLNDMISRFPDGLNELRHAIRTSLENYEPRLSHVQVAHIKDDDNPLSLKFEVSADLVVGEKPTAISFSTHVQDSGVVDVRR